MTHFLRRSKFTDFSTSSSSSDDSMAARQRAIGVYELLRGIIANKIRLRLRYVRAHSLYSNEYQVLLNPCLQPELSELADRRATLMRLELKLPECGDPTFLPRGFPHRDEYISEPPISTLGLKMYPFGKSACGSCSLRVETGIKVSDVYEACYRMLRSVGGLHGSARRSLWD